MRHVTDGELHAFLDGAADLLPAGRGEEVRDHIAECLSCRERLQDEETVRSQARDILDGPDLGELGLPTFEELRERAEAPGPGPFPAHGQEAEAEPHYRGPLRGVPLAWAATIVLALGVGWMGNQAFSNLPAASRSRPALEFSTPEPPGAGSLYRASDSLGGAESQEPELDDVVATSAARMETAEDPASPETDTDVARDKELSGTGSETLVVTASRRGDERVEAPAPVNVVPAGRPIPTELAEQQRAMALAGIETEGRKAVVGLRETVAEEQLNVTDSSGAMLSFAQGVGAGVDVLAQAPPVSDSLENSLAVPGLKVTSIEWEERVSGVKALLIRQILSPGDTLELRYLGLLLGTDPETRRQEGGDPGEEAPGLRAYANVLEASLPPGWNQVVMERGRGLLVARAPIEEDHLKALLKSLH